MAQPPFITESGFANGLTLRVPSLEYFQNGQDHVFQMHVFNSSNGIPLTNVSVDCSFHLYRQNGSHVYEASNTSFEEPYDFQVSVGGGNFSVNGQYSYSWQCLSNENLGGYITVLIDITPNGEEPTVAKAIFYIGLLGLLLFFLVLIFWAHMQDQSELARFWWFSFMWIPIWAIAFIGWSMANDFLTSQGVITGVLYYGWLILGILYPFFLLVLILYTFYYIYKQKEVQELVKRGFSLEDAKSKVYNKGRGRDQW